MKLKILHTNDVHSNYENFTRAASLIKQLRDSHTLFLEAGDFADFKSLVLRGTNGMAAVELLESVGYDAITIGNNEMFCGVETLEFMATHSSVPFISNNLLKKDKTPIKGVHPSIFIEKNGLRILITGSSPDPEDFNDVLGLHVTPYKEAIRNEIERNKGKYDICILLSHIGTFRDEVLKIEGIDIIVSAHDHKLFSEAKMVNGAIMNSAGCYGEHVGILELEIINGNPTLLHSSTISTKNTDPDDEAAAILSRNKEKATAVLSKPICEMTHPLWHDVIEENPITNLLADSLKDLMQTDIGLINSGIYNAGVFDFLTEKKLIEICPSTVYASSFELRGIDLRRALEQSLDPQICLEIGNGPGFRGRFKGKLHVSGAVILHDGENVIDILIGEEPLEDDRWYSVGSSFHLTDGRCYQPLANNRNPKYYPAEIRDCIKFYADNEKCIEKALINRWVMFSNPYLHDTY